MCRRFATMMTFKTLFMVVMLQVVLASAQDDNLALEQPAYESSIYTNPAYGDAVASRAVDGNTNSIFNGLSCSSTETNDTDPWWAVDLGANVQVTTVTITNRGDCVSDCANRLHDFNIGLTNTTPEEVAPSLSPLNYEVCYTYAGIFPAGMTIALPTSCANSGRYLIIQILGPNNTLTLCEVAVAGQVVSDTTSSSLKSSTLTEILSSTSVSPQPSSTTTIAPPSTSTAEPTVSPPNITPEPYTTLTLNGTFVASDDISFDCSNQYLDSFRNSYKQVISDINSQLAANNMCTFTSGLRTIGPDVSLLSYQDTARVQFKTVFYPDNHQVISDVEICTFEIGKYISDINNWPYPIISATNDCPDCSLQQDRFDSNSPQWETNN